MIKTSSLPVISFFTNDWEYPAHAKRLRSECKKFGFLPHIVRKSTTGDYIKNTAMKPFVIKEAMHKFKTPVCWIDVDAIIMKSFEVDVTGYDIALCEHHNGEKLARQWAVAFMVFNYTPACIELVDKWCELATNCTDESAFELAWRQCSDIKIKVLPETFHFVKWSHRLEVPEDTIICHQISKSEDKLRRKYGNKDD